MANKNKKVILTIAIIAVAAILVYICCNGPKILGGEKGSHITYIEAYDIAQNSNCIEKGTLLDNKIYNPNSKTWWIDLEMKPEFQQEGCSPACVISEETKTAEINWRCTGLLPQ